MLLLGVLDASIVSVSLFGSGSRTKANVPPPFYNLQKLVNRVCPNRVDRSRGRLSLPRPAAIVPYNKLVIRAIALLKRAV